MSTSPAEIELVAEGQRVLIDTIGAGLRAYSSSGREHLDSYPPDRPSSSGRGQVLIPWPNRIEDGSYEFDGQRHQLELTEPDNGNAIHGLVRWEPWNAVEHDSHRAVLEHLLGPAPGYPFTVELRIEYSLSPRGLEVRTTATNVGADACPYGSGAHPYLTVGTDSVNSLILHLPAQTVISTNERGIPVDSSPVEQTEYDFRRPKLIGPTQLDHAFTDLLRDEEGIARVSLAGPRVGTGLVLWMDDTHRYLQVFTGDPLPDVNRRSLAVEPMTCPPNAFRTGDAHRLEPGESFSSAWGISPS